MVDLAVYAELMAQDNKDQINRLKRNLTHALRRRWSRPVCSQSQKIPRDNS